jgi:hypothetical protein
MSWMSRGTFRSAHNEDSVRERRSVISGAKTATTMVEQVDLLVGLAISDPQVTHKQRH